MREKHKDLIDAITLLIMRNDSPKVIKVEYFGFFLDRLVTKLIKANNNSNSFNSANFIPSVRKGLDDYATKVATLFFKDDPMFVVGNLHEFLTIVWENICGLHPEVNQAQYNFRCLLRGVVEHISINLDKVKFENNTPQGMVVNTRRLFSIRGVLRDLIMQFPL